MGEPREYDRTARLNRICQLLYQYPEGLTARRLAEICGVSVRTVYRDLDAIDEEMRCPIWQLDGRWGIEVPAFLPPLKLGLSEAMALFLAARLMSRYSDERDASIESALSKLAVVMPRPVGKHVTDTVVAMRHRSENAHYARLFEMLSRAWAEGRRARIWYPSRNEATSEATPEERLVEPYFLEPSLIGHSCYLIAYCHHAGALRTFKLERIQHVELTDQPYHVPAGFDPNDYLKSSWGIVADEEVEVRLRFSPKVAARVRECVWHPSQSANPREDGTLDFTVRVAGTMEITPWILSWGSEVEVLAPTELRARISRTAERMAQLYAAALPDPAAPQLHDGVRP